MHAASIVFALSLFAAAPPASDPVSTNGSFEKLAPNGFPADWGAVGKTVRFALQADGRFHEYRLEPGRDPNWAGEKITAIRIDPGNGATSGEFAIDYVRGAME